MNKKNIIIIVVCVVLIGVAGLSIGGKSYNSVPKEEKKSIVTTTFPEYDWVRQIVGDNNENIEITLLQKNGVDLHNYKPTTDDLVKISRADMFVYIGGHSDGWVKDALNNPENKNRVVVNLSDVLKDSLKPLKMVEGMEHKHDHDKHHEHHENDEHFWLSLQRAQRAVTYMSDRIKEIDDKKSMEYTENTEIYLNKLMKLDREYARAAKESKNKTIVFADRFPFFYMADDYGLKYYAAFSGCSTDSEASFKTVAFLSKTVDKLGIKNLLTIETRSHKIPETIIKNTKSKDIEILKMDSLQSVTEESVKEGKTYYDTMTSNLEVLKKALGAERTK